MCLVEAVGDQFADAWRTAFFGEHHAAERGEVVSVGAVIDLFRQIGSFVGADARGHEHQRDQQETDERLQRSG